ncbi:MAG: histidine phosphatase family protein [Candidatus Zixiibacteriota bacterium]
MKALILVRHAKAANRHKHFSDFERPLTSQGEKDAKRLARELKSRGIQPGQIISSPANRALETAHILARELDYPIQRIFLKQSVYDAPDFEALYGAIRNIEDQHETAILVGHNPSLEQLAASLVAGFEICIPKAGVVQIRLEKDSWRDVLPGDGKIESAAAEVPKTPPGPTDKQMRRDLNAKIAVQLTNIVNELGSGDAQIFQSEIKKAADILTRKIIKVHKAERIG